MTMTFLYGVLGTVAVLILFFGGVFAGWKLKQFDERRTAKRFAKELSEEERRRLREEQDAFRQLQNYNTDTAYGYKPDYLTQGGDQA
jgi:hypothetical protein